MIILIAKGGLGNQMFQLAAALSLAKRWNLKVFVNQNNYLADISLKNNYIKRNFDAHLFEKLDNVLVNNYSILRRIKKKIKLTELNFQLAKKKYFVDYYLSDYFQSEYFFDATVIKDYFKFPVISNYEYKMSLIEIEKRNISISIHVRRGDYVDNKDTYKTHGVCERDYYLDAIKYFYNKFGFDNVFFYLFSDDTDYVKTAILDWNLQNCEIVDLPNSQSWFDMSLMSKCKHNIIANSTYSWWGAYLNENPEKIIVAPKKWFSDPLKNSSKILPDSWLKF